MSLLVVAFTVLLERKLLGGIQLRTGPMNVGWIRIVQTVVDRIKLLTKRVMRSKVIFTSGAFVLTGVMINWNVSIMWIITLLTVLSYVFLSGVYHSECMYSMYGGLRAVISMISYDIILIICLLVYGNIWLLLMLFVFSAEVGRTPVDLVEGESELVSGFNTEYAGGVFVGYFLGEYLVLTLFFLTWWYSLNVGIMLLIMAMVFRRSYPRMKYQELMILFWRTLFCIWVILILS